MNLLTIYDIKNSYIAFSAPVPEVLDVFYQWSAFFVVTKSGHLWRFSEKDINSKLDILFKKNLYDLAVRLAETSNDISNHALADIYMHYGDFLYKYHTLHFTVFCVIESLLDRFFPKLEFDRLLIIFQTYDYEPGLLYLYDKAGMCKEILQLYITKSDCKNDYLLDYLRTENNDLNLIEQQMTYLEQEISKNQSILDDLENKMKSLIIKSDIVYMNATVSSLDDCNLLCQIIPELENAGMFVNRINSSTGKMQYVQNR
uniref:Uncharacterized protein n=1 Tax=Romanomermis culicivorax TaxID=13658 RepID=A0A915HLY1_ROMCU